jgi:hypothetical protein
VTPRVHQEWARRVAAEYTSAAIAAQVLTWSIQQGLPPDLLLVAHRVVGDELEHARVSHEVLAALGGSDEPIVLLAERLVVPHALPEALVRNFCLGETFAVPYFAEMRRRATHPAVRPALDRILEDEAVHRAFGWAALDALIAEEPALVARIAAQLPGLVDAFSGYASPPDAPLLTEEERACGLLEHAEYAALYAETWRDDIVPRFERRGIRAE